MSPSSPVPEASLAAPWLHWVARCGIVAEGMIYLLIGGLALAGAFDPAQRSSGSARAMSLLARVPLGRVVLGVLALGLAAFVLWQVMLAILDPECRRGRWAIKRLALRIQHLWNAALHCVLVGMAGWQVLHAGQDTGQNHTQQHLVATVMELPGGRWLIGGIGVGITLFGLVECVIACRPSHHTHMDLSHTRWRRPVLALRVLGYAARGVLFGLIGAFLIRAAWGHDPHQATGIAGALHSLRQQPGGGWLLGAVAVGLIAFGLAQLAKARYHVNYLD